MVACGNVLTIPRAVTEISPAPYFTGLFPHRKDRTFDRHN
jgi:hypothetical protein